MVTMNIIYKGNLRTESTHAPSGDIVTTDAPVDNRGKGEAFSPTDLLTSSLGSCMLTIMGIKAEDMALDISDTKVTVVKHMSKDLPRRVCEIDVDIKIPLKLSDKQLVILENSAKTCPVAKSIHPDININFNLDCE